MTRALATLAIGAIGALLAGALCLPMPYLLGGFVAVGLAVTLLRLPLKMPPAWRNPCLVVIGLQLGGSFDGRALAQLAGSAGLIAIMFTVSLVVLIGSQMVLARFGGMRPMTAFLASVPGGVSVVTGLADGVGDDMRRVALVHSMRLIAMLLLTPVFVLLVMPGQSYTNGSRIGALLDGGPLAGFAILCAAGIASWWLARRLPIPAGALVIPMVVAALLHATGLLQTGVPPLASFLAQTGIGCAVGARFVGYRLREILRDGWLALTIGAITSGLCMALAVPIAALSGHAPLVVFLCLLPGGAPELGSVALAMDADPALVAAIHFLRLVAVILFVPAVMTRWSRRTPQTHS